MCEWTRVTYLCGHTREYYTYECSVYLSGRTGCALTRHELVNECIFQVHGLALITITVGLRTRIAVRPRVLGFSSRGLLCSLNVC